MAENKSHNNNESGISSYVSRSWRAAGEEIEANRKNSHRSEKSLPSPDLTRRKFNILAAFTGIGVLSLIKNPSILSRFFIPGAKKVDAAEPHNTKIEKETTSVQILGIATVEVNRSHLREETSINSNSRAQLDRGRQVVIKSQHVIQNETWYQVDLIPDKLGDPIESGYMHTVTLSGVESYGMAFDTEVYSQGIIFAYSEQSDREVDAIREAITLFVDYLKNNNIPSAPPKVFATSNIETIVDIIVDLHNYPSRNGIGNSMEGINGVAEINHTAIFNFSEGSQSVSFIEKTTFHELIHAGVQQYLLKNYYSSPNSTDPVMIFEGFAEYHSHQALGNSLILNYASALGTTTPPKDIIKYDRFLELNNRGLDIYSYAAFFCQFLEEQNPGGLVSFFTQLGVGYDTNRNINWRIVFSDIFGKSYEDLSDEFMIWKGELEIPEVAVIEAPNDYGFQPNIPFEVGRNSDYRVLDGTNVASILPPGATIFLGMVQRDGFDEIFLQLRNVLFQSDHFMRLSVAQSSGFIDLVPKVDVSASAD
jgi:hypothetical protein